MTIDWTTIFLGVGTSLIASLIFTYLFTRLKPKINISNVIAIRNNNGITSYKIKVINESKFPVINVKAEMAYISYFQVPGGQERYSYSIVLNKSEIFSLDKLDKTSTHATYSYMFVTTEDIQNGLIQSNRQYIRFKLSAVHSLTNVGQVFEKHFDTKSFIVGAFNFGNNLNIGQ